VTALPAARRFLVYRTETLALVLLLGACSPRPAPLAPPVSAAAPVLAPGSPVERELRHGETHEYRLAVAAGSYLEVRIEQPGIAITARLLGPGGEAVAVADDPGRRGLPARLPWIAAAGGEHRLVVTAHDADAPPGRYRLELLALRPAAAGDAERVAAQRAFAEGRRLQDDWGEDALRRGLARLREALALWRSAADRTGEVDALLQIADAGNSLGDFEGALTAAGEALELARAAGYREGGALGLQILAEVRVRRNLPDDRAAARALFDQALALWKVLRNPVGQARALYVTGFTYGPSREALPFLEQALALQEEAGDGDARAGTLVAIGHVSYRLGDIGDALARYEQALALSRSTGDPRTRAFVLTSLGQVYSLRGELAAALACFAEALRINQRLGERYNEVYSLNALGSIYADLGDLDQTLDYYARALALGRELKSGGLVPHALTNLGWVHQALGDPGQALKEYAEALALDPERKDGTGTTALALHNAGIAYLKLDRPQEGLSYLDQALALRQQSGDRADQAKSFLQIGLAHQRLGERERAAANLRRALDLAEQVGNANLQAECLYRWAVLDRDEGRLGAALARIEKALGIVESVRSRVTDDRLRTSFFAARREFYEFYVDLLMRLAAAGPGDEHRAAAFEASERARARSLLDLLAGRVDVRQGIAPELRQREAELQARLSWLQDERRAAPAQGGAELQAQEEQAGAAMERLEAEIRDLYPRYAEVRYPVPLRLAEVQARLDGRTALLEYFVGRDGSFLFVVTRDGIASHPLPAAADLAVRVRSIRAVLEQPGRRHKEEYVEQALDLYRLLVAPAAAVLAGKPDLLIAPDGPLYLLPFEALLTDAAASQGRAFPGLPYLLRSHAVSYVPSASVFARLREPAPRPSAAPPTGLPPKAFLAFADPLYGAGAAADRAVVRSAAPDLARPELPRLADSETEVRRIAALYPREEVQLYLGKDATKENVKNSPYMKDARRIHFATHGFLDELHPERSSLVLTRSPQDDGYLSVSEIFNLELSSDLLVLSACETALGKQVTGEGVVGLTRAFLYAGAKSLVVSLWEVADRSAPDLMVSFYRHLGTASKAEALRRSKLEMADGGYAPYYWASFALAGDPR
jgi:CHAT domain-containing protein/Tfp pilus assembly protein PilF